MPRRVQGFTSATCLPPEPDAPGRSAEAGAIESLRLYKTMFERGSLGQLIVDYASLRISVAVSYTHLRIPESVH